MISRRNFSKSGLALALTAPSFGSFAIDNDANRQTLVAGPSLETLQGTTEPFEALTFGQAIYGIPMLGQLGQTLSINVQNRLDQTLSVHWHGLRVPNSMDGVARFGSPLISSGDAYTYEVPLKDPGLYWFHSHHNTIEQVGKGLYGALLVVDENQPKIPETLVILDDWPADKIELGSGNETHQMNWEGLDYSSAWSHDGLRGRLVTVNGSSEPELEIPSKGCCRYRMLNAATDRVFRPQILGAKSWLVAIDGFDIKPMEITGQLFLGPGQRLDFLIEGSSDQQATLALGEDIFGSGKRVPLRINEQRALGHKDVFKELTPWKPTELRPGKVDLTASVKMTSNVSNSSGPSMHWHLNGAPNNADRPVFTAKVGQTVEIRLENETSFNHVMHFHGQHVFVVENPSTPWEAGHFRDSVSFPSRTKTILRMKAANPGKWPLHCHMLTHQNTGMNAWFEVA